MYEGTSKKLWKNGIKILDYVGAKKPSEVRTEFFENIYFP